MKRIIKVIVLLCLCTGYLQAQSVYPGRSEEKMKVEMQAPVQVRSFGLKEVRLLPSRFRENMMCDSAWMVSIEVNRLLHSFRTMAGVWAGREGGYESLKKYGGWESLDCELRGHTTGHLLSAYALMYASTGSEVFRLKGDSIVSELAKVQEVLGSGYLSAFPENLINRNIRGESVWAPWYTLHKLLAGLMDQYVHADNRQALEMAEKMGRWAYDKLKPLDEETRRRMLRNEFGGVNEAFYNLYALTADERYRWLAQFFYHNDVIDPLKENRDDLGTKHTNTFIPKILAEARNYELTGSKESRAVADFFWHTMVDHHTFAPGCSSQKEHFFDTKKFSHFLNGYTGETCCTYNMLKLSRHLFCWQPDVRVADYYERALYNHILGQQDPETGMVCYFLPMLTGAHKVYSTKENSFWCCVGSGFENHAKYAEAIYYHNAEGIYVNLFIPSEVDWREKGMTIRQETAFPAGEQATFTVSVERPVRTTLFLRYPSWSGKMKVTVNGKRISVRQKPGTYVAIEREWKEGDRVEVTCPMELRIETTPDDPSRGALLYGPIVLAGELGTEGMQHPAPYSNPELRNDYYTYDYRIPESLKRAVLRVDARHPAGSLERVEGGLKFRTKEGIVVSPLYEVHRQRYVVYWNLEDF
ncbi:MAG: glycoside hydrolase family 127 protein [Bacteroides sp.]|nr:glycoside hydrolase family 127 protein [Bacteroides sp.]